MTYGVHGITVVVKLKRRKEGGVVLCFGEGGAGQLGLGPDILQRKKPAKVDINSETIVDVCSGAFHTLCLTDKGKVSTAGSIYYHT